MRSTSSSSALTQSTSLSSGSVSMSPVVFSNAPVTTQSAVAVPPTVVANTPSTCTPSTTHDSATTSSPGLVQTTESTPDGSNGLAALVGLFGERLEEAAIEYIFTLSNSDFNRALDVLVEGPTTQMMLALHSQQFDRELPRVLYSPEEQFWHKAVAFYKTSHRDLNKPVMIDIPGTPVVDTGGVLRQFYTDVFLQFATNRFAKLFEGPECYIRPYYSAGSYHSGLFGVLGRMVAHSIRQCGVGFPYLAPYCYWYVTKGEDHALHDVSLADVGEDVANVIDKVHTMMGQLTVYYDHSLTKFYISHQPMCTPFFTFLYDNSGCGNGMTTIVTLFSQISSAKTGGELSELAKEDHVLDVLANSGISEPLQVYTNVHVQFTIVPLSSTITSISKANFNILWHVPPPTHTAF